MVSIGTLLAGNTSLPQKRTEDGHVVPDASLAEVHAEIKDQVEKAVEFGV